MKLKLIIVAGPHQGREFEFDGRDTFLVGRVKDAHFKLSNDDPYFSRRHFLLEINPPRCRLIDLNSRNGVLLNGARVHMAEVQGGDEIAAGHTVFKVAVVAAADSSSTSDLATAPPTCDYQPSLPLIPGYRIDSELGRGGMGVVYRATRESDGLVVAVKAILPAEGTNRKSIDRFLRECEILRQLEHPNIVAFRECGEAAGLIYLVMDLVDGPDVASRLKATGPADVRTAVRMMCQMLSGLAHAHAKGFVHRDIKPANLLIASKGDKRIVKLADFGLARACESSRLSGLTMQGEVGGTPAFMAPEQVTHFREVKPTADQYSAAAALYTMLTNRLTHDWPEDVGAQIAHLVTAAPTPISEQRTDVPPELAAVVHKALSREPDERYPDVLTFRKELKRFA